MGNKSKILSEEMEEILNAMHDDILISDGNGLILKVSKTFEQEYGVTEKEVIGKTVYEMESQGIFKPSVIAKALECGNVITMGQKNKRDRDIVVTATPVRDKENNIIKVVSFSRDITDFLNLKKQYEILESQIERYAAEIEELRRKTIQIGGMVGSSEGMQKILRVVDKVSGFDANVLITGPSGVGKTMMAKAIHAKSKRSQGPFIEINCGAIPDQLLESELFGYERGSFTGASKDGKIGLIELSHEGSLFLDEISELPIGLQVKILKAIQDKTFTRVGGTKEITVDFRLIAASNREFEKLIEEKLFREDLYYRLNVITIDIPKLKDRKEDILPLIMFFIKKFNDKYQLTKTIEQKTLNLLNEYDWPGNIRELENVIERSILISESDKVTPLCLPENITQSVEPSLERLRKQNLTNNEAIDLGEALEDLEGALVKAAYEKYKTTIGVAKALGISQPTATRKIRKHVGHNIHK